MLVHVRTCVPLEAGVVGTVCVDCSGGSAWPITEDYRDIGQVSPGPFSNAAMGVRKN